MSFVRILVVAIIVYVVLRIIGRILRPFLSNPPSSSDQPPPPSPSSQKPKEQYTDVQDARYKDVEEDAAKPKTPKV